MSNILEVKNVIKQYGNYTALNSVSLQVPKGSIYGLLGPNGAGKTSLIRIINQITMPDSGEIILDGQKTCTTPRATYRLYARGTWLV
ncbi:ABC transporter ATP-binding protein [Flavobacterium psychrophilum]|nr:ABC transporter ATP-binding protein [Flavobacterium psychrophilum]